MEKKQTFPSEKVTLPSKGLLYPKSSPLSKGVIEMKYMTAREEDVLTNQSLIQKGIVIDELLKSLIITPNVDYNELLVGDKNAIMVAARVLGYGADYSFSYNNEEHIVDLTKVEDKLMDESLVVDGKNEFYFTLPASKIEVTFKLLTHGDEKKLENELKGLKKLNKKTIPEVSTRMKHMIVAVDGDVETKTIREFVDTTLLARDARELRNYSAKIQPDVDLSFDYEDARGDLNRVDIPIEVGFFWPDASV
jgi:hypothetical protein|tara:strand:- start:2365 stop:3114 length:750 start_codon:yes stop_codon:yes gene_type:complete